MSLLDENILLENFSRCNSRHEIYQYIIELGNDIVNNDIEKKIRNDTNRIFGCQSRVWITVFQDENGYILIEGDSDSLIVKGLINIIRIIFHKMKPVEVLKYDINKTLYKLSLTEHLTPSRTQGLYIIINTIYEKIECILSAS